MIRSKPYLLGIDVGTSAIKCVVFDEACNEVAISQAVGGSYDSARKLVIK